MSTNRPDTDRKTSDLIAGSTRFYRIEKSQNKAPKTKQTTRDRLDNIMTKKRCNGVKTSMGSTLSLHA